MGDEAEPTEQDRRMMRAALNFGRRGQGVTAPNPSVAALLINDGIVVGRGVTAPGGRPHAETQAIQAAGRRARGATLYVTLEPCSHHGHTRPCAEAIIEAGVARVVVAVGDPDPRVAGRGVAMLRDAGIEVVDRCCEATGRQAHIGHILRVTEGRPTVTLKLAETPDGFAGRLPGQPRLMITGPVANDWVHMARAMCDAVLIGTGTLRADNPALTVRLAGMGGRQPARVVLDRSAELSPTSRLMADAQTVPVIVVVGPDADPMRAAALRQRGADLIETATDETGRLDIEVVLRALAARGFTRIFCEGGPALAGSLIAGRLADRLYVLTGPDRLGSPGVPALDRSARAALADPDQFRLIEDRPLGNNRLRQYERTPRCLPD